MALIQCERCGKTFDLRNPRQRKWYIGRRDSDIYGLVNTCLLCDECHEQLVKFMEDADEESFYPKVLRLLDDATIAQLDSFAEYAKQRAVIKRTEELQRDMERWRKEKEKEDGN